MLFQQPAIGGQRDFRHAQILFQDANEIRQIRPQQRFAAGQTHFLDPQLAKGAHDPRQLRQAYQLVLFQKGMVRAENLLGHAIGAAKIAAIGDRDAQIAQRAAELVT